MSENDPTSPREQMKHPTPHHYYRELLESLLEALVRQCNQADSLDMNAGVTTQWIRQLVKKHSPRENTDLRSRDKP